MNTLQQGLQLEPAPPQGFPARRAVARTSQIATLHRLRWKDGREPTPLPQGREATQAGARPRVAQAQGVPEPQESNETKTG